MLMKRGGSKVSIVEKSKKNLSKCICMKCPSYGFACKVKSMPNNAILMMGDSTKKIHAEAMFCAYEKSTCIGNGFTFVNYNAHDMLFSIELAVNTYKTQKAAWKKMQIAGMNTDFSWKVSATHYTSIYLGMN